MTEQETQQDIGGLMEERKVLTEAGQAPDLLAPLNTNSVKQKEIDRMKMLYDDKEIISALYDEREYFKEELKKKDAQCRKQDNEIARQRAILDGYVQDKHNHENDVRKDGRMRFNMLATSLYGSRPTQTFPIIVALVIALAFISFIALSDNPNVSSGFEGFMHSPATELTVALIIIVPCIAFIAYMRYRRR